MIENKLGGPGSLSYNPVGAKISGGSAAVGYTSHVLKSWRRARQSAAKSAREAVDSGLVNPKKGRLGFFRHNRRNVIRTELNLSGQEFESAHMLPQAVGDLLRKGGSSYSPGTALTTLLPKPVHTALDQGWVHRWKAAKASGKPITAGDVYRMVEGAIADVPTSMLSPEAKGTLAWKLWDEMFIELALESMSVIYP